MLSPSRLGGAERYVGWISEELIKQGHNVLIGIRRCEQVHEFYRSLNLPVREIAISGKLNPFAKQRVAALIEEFRPGVVHTHLSTASHWGLRAAADADVAGVGHVHSFNTVTPYQKAHKVIAVSKAVRDHLAENGISNAEVVYPSSKVESAEPASDIRSLASNVVSCAARLRDDKGVGVLLEAFRDVQREVVDVALVLCGDGPMREELEHKARGAKLRVVFAGYRDDVPSVFAASEVAVLPSVRPEGYGMALYEAQSVGTPVVATQSGGAPESIVPGVTGLVVPPGDSKALARALVEMLHDSKRRVNMGAAARDFAASRSLKSSAQCLIEVFTSPCQAASVEN